MQIKKEFTIDAPASKVWHLIGRDFDQVDRWASSVDLSTATHGGKTLPGAPMAGRVCETELGRFDESIVEFDEKRRVVAYSATGEKMPFFLRSAVNRWSLTSLGGSRTRVEMHLRTELAFPFGLFMGPVMKLQFNGVLNKAVEELKHYAETGEPHPRKAALLRAGAAEAA